jgi:hypothetical protein
MVCAGGRRSRQLVGSLYFHGYVDHEEVLLKLLIGEREYALPLRKAER